MFIEKRTRKLSMDGSRATDKGPVRRAAGWLLTAFFFLIPLGYMLLSLGIFNLLAGADYASLLAMYTHRFPHAFDAYTVALQSFTPAWHEWIGQHRQAGLLLLTAMPVSYVVCSVPAWRYCRRLVSELGKGMVFLARGLKGCSPAEKVGLFILLAGVLVYRLYFYFANPLQTDELCSYLYFVRPGFFIAVTSYPIPNNHVFFNACCVLLNLIPGLSIKAVMRLPAIAGDLFLLYSIFCLVRRWDGYGRAMVSVAAVAFCYLTSYYAVQGRGYQWQVVFALVSAIGCWECFLGPGRRERQGSALFIAGATAGLYINPMFVYHVTALVLAGWWICIRNKDRKGLLFLGRCIAIMAGWLAVLYMPLVVSSSWKALVANDYVKGSSYAGLLRNIPNLAHAVKDIINLGIPGLCCMIVVVWGLLAAYRKKIIRGLFYDSMLLYLVALMVSLTGWILYKRLYPPERGICFVVPAVNLVFINACYDLFGRRFMRRSNMALALGALLALKIAISIRGLYWDQFGLEQQIDVQLIRAVEKDIKELDAFHPTTWQITTSDDFYPMYIQEYLIRQGRKQDVFFDRTTVKGDVVFVPEGLKMDLSSDDLAKRYVLWKENGQTSYGRGMRIYISGSLAGTRGSRLYR